MMAVLYEVLAIGTCWDYRDSVDNTISFLHLELIVRKIQSIRAVNQIISFLLIKAKLEDRVNYETKCF